MTPSPYEISTNWDLELLVELFGTIRDDPDSRPRFEWLYGGNPCGDPYVWILTRAGEPVGFTAAVPRDFWIDGTACRGLIGADTTIHPDHRTLGPALQLRRAASRPVDRGEFAFLLSFPLPAMLAVHRRVRHPHIGNLVRRVLPIHSARLLADRIGRLSGAVAPVLDAGLGLWRGVARLAPTAVAVAEAEEFDADYAKLDASLGTVYGVIGRRAPGYLDWRFRERPAAAPRILEARGETGSLLGFCIWEREGAVASVRDIVHMPHPGVARSLLRRLARLAAAEGVESVALVFLEGHPSELAARRIGFLDSGDRFPVVVYRGEAPWAGTGSSPEDANDWLMTVGDRDV